MELKEKYIIVKERFGCRRIYDGEIKISEHSSKIWAENMLGKIVKKDKERIKIKKFDKISENFKTKKEFMEFLNYSLKESGSSNENLLTYLSFKCTDVCRASGAEELNFSINLNKINKKSVFNFQLQDLLKEGELSEVETQEVKKEKEQADAE